MLIIFNGKDTRYSVVRDKSGFEDPRGDTYRPHRPLWDELADIYIPDADGGDMGKRILVVDDSAFQRTVIRDALEAEFEVVAEAENGAEAVAMFEEHAPDGISMDVVMPEMTGIEATAAIKDRSPETTIVMCTSVDQQEKMMEAVKAGADGYVTKPVDGERLVTELITQLG